MKAFTAIVERDFETNLYVGYDSGLPGAHSQGETLDELQENLREFQRKRAIALITNDRQKILIV